MGRSWEDMQALLEQVGSERIEIEASLQTPDGLLITCRDGEEARRLQFLLRLLLPLAAEELVEVIDRRVLCRWPGIQKGTAHEASSSKGKRAIMQ